MSANSSTGNARFLRPRRTRLTLRQGQRRWPRAALERNLVSTGHHDFDRNAERHEVFSLTLPHPLFSGSLHVGHVFLTLTLTSVARYQRMRGKAVFYPMGWDDNGLPLSVAYRTSLGSLRSFAALCGDFEPRMWVVR